MSSVGEVWFDAQFENERAAATSVWIFFGRSEEGKLGAERCESLMTNCREFVNGCVASLEQQQWEELLAESQNE